jgi:hypothetical protein
MSVMSSFQSASVSIICGRDHLGKQGVDGLIALMMEAASTYETSVNFYQSTWCNNPEDSHLHVCCLRYDFQDDLRRVT